MKPPVRPVTEADGTIGGCSDKGPHQQTHQDNACNAVGLNRAARDSASRQAPACSRLRLAHPGRAPLSMKYARRSVVQVTFSEKSSPTCHTSGRESVIFLSRLCGKAGPHRGKPGRAATGVMPAAQRVHQKISWPQGMQAAAAHCCRLPATTQPCAAPLGLP